MTNTFNATELLNRSVQLVNQGAKTRNLGLIDHGLNILIKVMSTSSQVQQITLQGLLGEFLIQRWQISASRLDLDRAIDLFVQVGQYFLSVPEQQLAIQSFHRASVALFRRFRRRRRIADIENAILLLEHASEVVTDRSSEEFVEMTNLLSSLHQFREKPPMIFTQAGVRDFSREDLSSPYALSNTLAWNKGTPRSSGLKWVHSHHDGKNEQELKGTNLNVLFLRTFKDDDTNFAVLNTLASAMEGGNGRINIVSDLRDRHAIEQYWKKAFDNNRSLDARISFTEATDVNWRKLILERMADCDVIVLHISPKDIDFPEFPFADPKKQRGEQFWDDFMDAPFIEPITGHGLLREVSYLNRMLRLPQTVLVCDEYYHETFEDLIALGGIMGDSTDSEGNFVTPRLTALDKQVGYLRKAYLGITYRYEGDETILASLTGSIRKALAELESAEAGFEKTPWKPIDLCGRSSVPRRLPPDNEPKLISFTDVEHVLFLPNGQITEIAFQDVLKTLSDEAIRIGCPFCHARLEKLFFYVDGLFPPKWPQADSSLALRARCQICGQGVTALDDMLSPQ